MGSSTPIDAIIGNAVATCSIMYAATQKGNSEINMYKQVMFINTQPFLVLLQCPWMLSLTAPRTVCSWLIVLET